MRLWSVHPRYLDRQGLTACWREGLLAQAVLAERTRGYRNHSQLVRFRAHAEPLAAVGAYLGAVAADAARRGYRFDTTKILRPRACPGDAGPTDAVAALTVTEGQLAYEWTHLTAKLARRSPDVAAAVAHVTVPQPHPLFTLVPGPVEPWERVAAPTAPTAGRPPS